MRASERKTQGDRETAGEDFQDGRESSREAGDRQTCGEGG